MRFIHCTLLLSILLVQSCSLDTEEKKEVRVKRESRVKREYRRKKFTSEDVVIKKVVNTDTVTILDSLYEVRAGYPIGE